MSLSWKNKQIFKIRIIIISKFSSMKFSAHNDPNLLTMKWKYTYE